MCVKVYVGVYEMLIMWQTAHLLILSPTSVRMFSQKFRIIEQICSYVLIIWNVLQNHAVRSSQLQKFMTLELTSQQQQFVSHCTSMSVRVFTKLSSDPSICIFVISTFGVVIDTCWHTCVNWNEGWAQAAQCLTIAHGCILKLLILFLSWVFCCNPTSNLFEWCYISQWMKGDIAYLFWPAERSEWLKSGRIQLPSPASPSPASVLLVKDELKGIPETIVVGVQARYVWDFWGVGSDCLCALDYTVSHWCNQATAFA